MNPRYDCCWQSGKAPWLSSTNNGERNKHFASMSWSEVETHIMNKQGAAAEAKIAACAVAARANNTAIQGPAVVGSGSTWMWGAVRTAQAAGIPYRHDFHGTPPGSPSASLNGSTTSTPTRSITSSPTPSASYNSSQFSDPESDTDMTGTGAGSDTNAIDLSEECIPDRPDGWVDGF